MKDDVDKMHSWTVKQIHSVGGEPLVKFYEVCLKRFENIDMITNKKVKPCQDTV